MARLKLGRLYRSMEELDKDIEREQRERERIADLPPLQPESPSDLTWSQIEEEW